MSFLKKLFSGGSRGGRERNGNIHHEYVRCSRCGEKIHVQVDLSHELTPQYEESSEGEYYTHKGVMGSGENHCFQTVEVELYFNAQKQLTSRYISGGEFITREEYYAGEQDES